MEATGTKLKTTHPDAGIGQAKETPGETMQSNPVTVQLPPFWQDDPISWFQVLDSTFATRGIKDPVTKFHYAMSELDSATCRTIRDVARRPVGQESFALLKATLCNAFEESSETRLDKLLALNQLEDRKPSELVRELRRFGDGESYESVVRRIFMHCLPESIRAAGPTNSSTALETLGERADKAHANQLPTPVCAVQGMPTRPMVLINARGQFRGRGRGRGRGITVAARLLPPPPPGNQ